MEYISREGNVLLKMPSIAKTPRTMTYSPKLDVSPELAPKDTSSYQSLIDILRWTIEFGQIDICL